MVVDCRAASTDFFLNFCAAADLTNLLAAVGTVPTLAMPVGAEIDSIDQFRRVVRELGNHSGYVMLCYHVQGEYLPLFDASNVRQQLRNDLGAREISLTRT